MCQESAAPSAPLDRQASAVPLELLDHRVLQVLLEPPGLRVSAEQSEPLGHLGLAVLLGPLDLKV